MSARGVGVLCRENLSRRGLKAPTFELTPITSITRSPIVILREAKSQDDTGSTSPKG